MSSSHTDTPASVSSLSTSLIAAFLPSITFPPCRPPSGPRLGEAGPGRRDHRLRRDAELLVQRLLRRRRAEVVDPLGLAGVPDERLPRLGDARLDRHPRPHRRWKYVLLIGIVLLPEPFHAGQRDNPRRDAVGCEQFACRHGDLHLAA